MDIKQDISFLNLFNITQPLSLLMASYREFKDDFHTILRWIKVLSVRYTVIGNKIAKDQEIIYNNICVAITQSCSLDNIKQSLLKLYPRDDEFELAFMNKKMPTKLSNKKARYLLARLEESN